MIILTPFASWVLIQYSNSLCVVIWLTEGSFQIGMIANNVFLQWKIFKVYNFVYFQGPLQVCLNPVSHGENQLISCISLLFFGPIRYPECRLLTLNLVSRKISQPIPFSGRQKKILSSIPENSTGSSFPEK